MTDLAFFPFKTKAIVAIFLQFISRSMINKKIQGLLLLYSRYDYKHQFHFFKMLQLLINEEKNITRQIASSFTQKLVLFPFYAVVSFCTARLASTAKTTSVKKKQGQTFLCLKTDLLSI